MDLIERVHKQELYDKKIAALKNFAKTVPSFKEWVPLELAVRYSHANLYNENMLLLVDYLLEKHEINYLDWKDSPEWAREKMRKGVYKQKILFLPDQREWDRFPFFTAIDPLRMKTVAEANGHW